MLVSLTTSLYIKICKRQYFFSSNLPIYRKRARRKAGPFSCSPPYSQLSAFCSRLHSPAPMAVAKVARSGMIYRMP